MSNNDEQKPGNWQQHNIEQLKYFRSLSLRQKLKAIEELGTVVERLRTMQRRDSSQPQSRPSAD